MAAKKKPVDPQQLAPAIEAPAAVPVAIVPAKPLCGAKTKQKNAKYPTCHRPAGWGTANAPLRQGRCKLHGGASPIKSGRYSRLIRPRVGELIEQFANDPDPLNVLPDLALARAMLVDFVERYDVWRDAVLAWHASWSSFRRPIPEEMALSFAAVIDEWENALRENEEPTERQLADLAGARTLVKFLRGEDAPARPREILDPAAAIQWINVISQIVKREQDSRADNAITRKDLTRVMQEMGKAVLKRVTDPETLKGIRSDWLEIRV